MYQKYQTEAVVLRARDSGENDRALVLYTEEFGLVFGRASAIRKENSKMRYALQSYSHAAVSLVRGKRGWRVAGARALSGAPRESAPLTAFARISELVVRLVQGEEANPYLFAALAEAHSAFVREGAKVSPLIEIVCVARILYALGYIGSDALSMALFTHTAYTGESLLEAQTMKDTLLSSINRAISETHL